MLVIKNYVFTPGTSGSGTIRVPYELDLEDFGKIVNVTRNSVLYDPEEGQAGATLSSTEGFTTLALEQNTSYCASSDKLQIALFQGEGTSGGPSSDVFVTNSELFPVPVDIQNIPSSFEIQNDSGSPISVTGSVSISDGSFGSLDSFGRLRVSNSFTLFDSSHRHFDNGLWATLTESGGSSSFSSYEGAMLLSTNTTSTSKVLRETVRVFPYQPGKSLLVLSSFVFAAPKQNLTQRVGLFGSSNGFFVEFTGNAGTLSFVRRSSVSGSIVETRISQSGGELGPDDTGWNVDKLDGTGPSGITIDPTKAQIMFADIEWLGAGRVRMGFILDGEFILCHTFDHANYVTSTYITTATLPLRYEILNEGVTNSTSTLRQICSTILSEGGYEVRGSQRSMGTPIQTPKLLSVAGTFYPVIAVRLKSSCLDSVVSVETLSLLGSGNNETYEWRLLGDPSVTGGTWVSAGDNSPVEYNLTATSVAGGERLASGYFSASNQGSPAVDISGQDFITYQLERNSFTSTPLILCLAVAGGGASQSVYGSLDWKEVSR